MVWLLNVKLTAEQSTYTYKAMAYWKLETGPQLILRLLRTISDKVRIFAAYGALIGP